MSGPDDDATLAATSGPSAGHAGATARATATLGRGRALGRYLILDELGSGGMGKVYTAYDPQLDRKLAIKLLHHGAHAGSDSSSSVAGSRLQREAQAMAQLSHRNVVAVHDVGVHEGQVFVAMEFVEGQTLRDWMAEGPHPWAAVVKRFAAAGRGLAAAHDVGLIHRDFKPANVLLGRDGRICVADFGLARRGGDPHPDPPGPDPDAGQGEAPPPALPELPELPDDTATAETLIGEPLTGPGAAGPNSITPGSPGPKTDSLSLRLTQTGAFVGTPAYMAPEQYTGATLDARSDQFSFCVALWEALYGERPFAGDNPAAIALAIHLGKLRDPPTATTGPPVPGWLRRIVERGLAHDPAARWPDMPSLLAALTRDPAVARRRWLGAAGVAAVLVAAVLGARMLDEDPAPTAPPMCEGAEAAFAPSWGPEQRAALDARYAETEAGWADEHRARLVERLDGWAGSWREAWTDACAATRIRGEQSEALLDARMRCLARHQTRFEAFVQALGEADDRQLQRASAALDALGDLRDCASPELVDERAPPPRDPVRRAEFDGLQAEFDAVHALTIVGQYDQARARLVPAWYRALALDHPRLHVEAHLALGDYHFRRSDRAEAEGHLLRCYEQALAGGMFLDAGRCAKVLAMNLVVVDERLPEADRWLRVAEALARYTDDPGLRLSTLEGRGRYYSHVGDPAAAMPYLEAALALAEERHGPRSQRAADKHFNLSVSYVDLYDYDAALVEVAKAQAIWADTLGPNDPRSLLALNANAVFSWRKGDTEAAGAMLDELIERRTRLFGADHILVADARFNLGAMLSDHYEPRAIEVLTQVCARYIEEFGAQSVYVAQCHANLAVALARTDPSAREQAAATMDEVIATMRSKREPTQPDTLTALALGVEVHRRAGNIERAHALAAELIELLERPGATEKSLLSDVCIELALLHLLDGAPELALPLVERSVEIATKDLEAAGPRKSAERQITLAETLAALGRDAEAASAAAQARAHLDALSSPPGDELRQRLARL